LVEEKWREEMDKVRKCQFNQSDILTLNVSGITAGFRVPISLLTSVKNSTLEAIFSGRHENQLVDGNIYINRNPKQFD
jgi:hypothetical protein